MDLSIIIVNYKSRGKLLNCLDSISRADLAAWRHETIIVENASGDDLSDLEGRPDTSIIKSERNLGMGGGNNLGISRARGRYVLILNPDTLIQGRAISTLLEYLESHPGVGLVGPKLLNPDGSLQYSCSRFPQFFLPFFRRTFLGRYFKKSDASFMMRDFDHASIRPVGWLMGSCLMFRREIQTAAGAYRPHFDERYFMYFEDTDLAREFWVRDLPVIYNPEAVVIHDHRRQSAAYPWYLALLTDRLAWKHIISWLKYFNKWGLAPYKPYKQYEED